MTPRPGRSRKLPAFSAALLAAAVSLSGGVATASPPAPGSSYAVLDAARAPRSVTLITGDTVLVTVGADGKKNYTVTAPDGRLADHDVRISGKNTYVYPRSAARLVGAKLLDEDLFNVTQLLADGYDDGVLPLIVTYTDAAAKARTQAVPAGARKQSTLSSIKGAALTADRPADFWRSLTASTTARSKGPAVLTGGIKKVWLDGKFKADLADSTAQIGAPEVWRDGNLGEGVDIAVLDTGIDLEHPDLDDRVAASTSFVPELDVTDRQGHGTHVASTIAGTGEASGGLERGVAPGARLHIGKVLDNEGSGQESWIIAGMEWAARDQKAKIVSMSLGGGPSDGSDPISQSLNQLSAETGALFTVAAGNAGPGYYTASAPGIAESALTVGAVDGADKLAEFSSWGPRVGDGGLKPDITAPGVDILAARSQYAAEGSGSYQLMSGTSMATPHVAGAVALLAAQHPDWTGQQLKDAIVSSAKPTPDYNPYQAGNGRLDIAATSKATVFATSSAYSGHHGWPVAQGKVVDREVTYTNNGDAPVVLDLTTQVKDAPAGLFTLSAPTVTVPAHGTAKVTLTAQVDVAPVDKQLSGRLVATASDGTRLSTMIGIGREGERYELKLDAKDRSGRPLTGDAILIGGSSYGQFFVEEGGTSLRLPPGDYTTWLTADVEGANGPSSLGLAVLTLLDVHLDRDRTVTYDARKARQLKVAAPQATALGEVRVNNYRDFGREVFSVGSSRWPSAAYDSVWELPTGKATSGAFTTGARWRLEQPALTMSSSTRTFDDTLVRRAAMPLAKGKHQFDAVLGDAKDQQGKAVVVRNNDGGSLEEQAATAAAAGAKLLVVVNDGPGKLAAWNDSIYLPPNPPPITIATLTHDEGEQLIGQVRQGAGHLTVVSNPTQDYTYDLSRFWDHVPADPSYRVRTGELARLDVSYRNFRPGGGIENRFDIWNVDWESAMNTTGMPLIAERADYVMAGTPYLAKAEILRETQQTEPEYTAYQAGSRTDIEWFGPIQRPRLSEALSPVRQGDQLAVVAPGWSDGGGNHIGTAFGNFDQTQKVSLYQGPTLVAEAERDQLSVSGLQPESRPYRLVVDNTRGTYPSPYSTTTRTEWSFTSGSTAEASPLSLIQLDYAISTDVTGRAGRHDDLTISPKWSVSSTAAGLSTPSLEISYDDGKTWGRAALRRTGAGWTTRLDGPRGATFVSLRAHAENGSGAAVDQTITRAFGLK
ncbi:S8 family peptidase [Kribbella sp. CA-293567]|uniref:S8 family peptidase n=1 Tax=Kribbella sp. CA-293567 TaxID=3002436 RepID=UPI0022DE7FC2|nr:S8 family serine peptidase [Kribbella sp. CA-293567]WBQ02254.1 S8 family serine peptidase [Kribbella sp. CA-293567]